MPNDKLELTKAEVEAIQNYVWQHVRATNGLAKKTWDRMWAFIQDEPIPLPSQTPIDDRVTEQCTLF